MLKRFSYVLGNTVRETAYALDRVGCRLQGNYAFTEERTFLPPRIDIGTPPISELTLTSHYGCGLWIGLGWASTTMRQ
jgi:hypothetical protein